jgi:hypothetical protein
MARRVMGLGLAGILLSVLWVWHCSGARPVVADVQLASPAAVGAPYRVEVVLRNEGFGGGQVEMTVRLRDRASGHTVQQTQKIALDEGETTLAVAEILAPAGDYAPAVEVKYPPR